MWHDMSMPVIIYHRSCPDGFGSAWLLQQSWLPDEAQIFPASYGDPLPDAIDDQEVHVVDFCYPSDQLVELCERANQVIILDHHQTAKAYLADSPFEVFGSVREMIGAEVLSDYSAVLDESHSGVGLTMQFTGKTVPFLYYLQDRDLWKFEMEDTPAMFAAITSRPYTIEAWDWMESMLLDDLTAEGVHINRYRDKLIEDILNTAAELVIPTGERVWVAAAPYAVGSDVAGILAARDPDWYAAYYVPYGDRTRFGLRSSPTGKDVAVLAEQLGGGGHKHSSGFEVAEW